MAATAVIEIVYEDPPEGRGRPKRDWETILAPLKANPGKWARVGVWNRPGSANQASQAARKRVTGFKFTSRNVDGKGHLYAQYLNGQA